MCVAALGHSSTNSCWVTCLCLLHIKVSRHHGQHACHRHGDTSMRHTPLQPALLLPTHSSLLLQDPAGCDSLQPSATVHSYH